MLKARTPTQPPPKGEGQEVVLPAVGVLSGPQTVSSKGEGQEVAIPIVDVLSGPQTVFPQGEGQEMALSVVDVLSEQEVALPVVGAVSGQQKVSPPSGGTEGGVLDLLFAQFNALHTSPAQIDTLKQTILQLAVMGRLVPQDPTDEPASRLLERIADARNSWISDGKKQGYREAKVLERKSKQPLPQLPSSVRLPNGWQWTTVLHANCIVVDCHNKTAPYIEHGIPLIRTSNIRNRGFRWKNLKYISQKTYEYWSRRCPPMAGDILFTREAPIGEASIVPDNMTLCMGQRMMLIRPFHELLSNKYLLYVMTSPNFLARLTESSIGATVKHLRVGAVETAALPLPPFKEQKRIVAKVDELLGMCDRLAAGLVSAETARTQLLDALLARA
ncbi:MAG: restriction endonuclease subunit S [Candidatus Promineifilaceae bacterium]